MAPLTHLLVTVAVATSLPGMVDLARRPDGLLLILAGLFGLLPDWLAGAAGDHPPDAAENAPQGDLLPAGWSHSLLLAALFGAAAGLLFGGLAGWSVFLAYGSHILTDVLGPGNAALAWPLRLQEQKGLGCLDEAGAGTAAALRLAAAGVVLNNLNRWAPAPAFGENQLLLWAGLAPAAALLAWRFCAPRKR